VINTLAAGDWVAKGRPLCLIGDSGTGKTHLLIGLGTAAAEAGYRVRYVLASRLVNELAEAENDRALTKVIARYGRVDLLCLDELGYLQLDRRGAELLFQVLTEREEKTAIAIASNEPFSGWTKTFTDPRLCAAIVDRLTYDATIIETGTTSYRLAHTRAAGANSSRVSSSQRRNTGVRRSVAIRSAGLSQARTFRGRWFSSACTAARSSAVWAPRSLPLGK
jgi:DNA replication protein DnaC